MSEDLRRPVAARRDDAARDRFATAVEAMRRAALDAAAALVAIDDAGHFLFEGCASVGEFGERYGIAAGEARMLVAVGRAVARFPSLAEGVARGRVPLRSAAVLGRVASDERLVREGDRWMHWALTESARALRRRFEQRQEEVLREGAPVVGVSFFVPPSVREDFDRARCLASRKAARRLSEGEAFEVVVEHYLDDFDPLRRKQRSRSVPPTAGLPGRYVPADVRRRLRERTGDRCAVPFCDHDVFLQDAHRVPHARGGDREAANLVRLCSRHHEMLDHGRLKVVGSADAPEFLDAEGRPLSRRARSRHPPRTARGAPEPSGDAPPPRGPDPPR